MAIRGHQRQSHLEGGGVDDRYQHATACIERRAGAHRTARERVDEFGSLILRVGKGSCNQRSSEAIKSEQLTCQSGSASCPPSSSSPASTCGKMRGRQGEHLHARRGPEEVQQRREHRGFPGAYAMREAISMQ